jgi:acyl-CoA hydrolase
MTRKPEKTLTMSEIMTPNMANFTGNVHGGYLLSFLDKVAYACAARYSGKPCVTLSVDQVFFKEPIYVGELVTCLAAINYVGKTSIEVGIKVIAEDLATGHKRHTNTSYFTMVCIDETTKRPTAAPQLILENDTEKRRFEEGKIRKAMRLQLHHAIESTK